MGGFGSGGWNATGRLTTAEALRLDVNRVNRAGALEPTWRGGWQWHLAGNRESSINLEARPGEVILRFYVTTGGANPEDVEQRISVDWRPCRFGGDRPFWCCPNCGHRATVLYGLPRFLCRSCHRLSYPSQRERGADRAQRHANRIRERLGCEPGWGNLPCRPKGMHRKTYERLVAQIEEADAVTDDQAVALLARLDRMERRQEARHGRKDFWK